MKFRGYNTEEYFLYHQNDVNEKKNFSKKFSIFASKYLQVEVSETYWIDKFE